MTPDLGPIVAAIRFLTLVILVAGGGGCVGIGIYLLILEWKGRL